MTKVRKPEIPTSNPDPEERRTQKGKEETLEPIKNSRANLRSTLKQTTHPENAEYYPEMDNPEYEGFIK